MLTWQDSSLVCERVADRTCEVHSVTGNDEGSLFQLNRHEFASQNVMPRGDTGREDTILLLCAYIHETSLAIGVVMLFVDMTFRFVRFSSDL